MPDGRKHIHARVAAVVTTTALTTIGLGVATSAPASAAPTDIDSAQAKVDRLSEQAEVAERRHDTAEGALSKNRDKLKRLTSGIRLQQKTLDTLRAQVASTVVADAYGSTGGSSAPAEILSEDLSKDSEVLLTNVTVVSEDTGGRGDAMAASNARLEQLSQRRVAVRQQVATLAQVEKRLRAQEQRVDSRAANANAVLDELEEKRIEALGGPAVAFAKAQVGKSYVYGATGPSSFDCSGLTMAAWQQAGVSLPHNSGAQYSAGKQISESELKPGDLVFYYSPISHVGIYIGDGQIVNALNPGSGVQISGLHDMPYSGAVRVG